MKNIYENIQNTKENIDLQASWINSEFSHPNRTIRLATSFSGIGAIEQAFTRLGLKYSIQFAGDIDDNCRKAYFANYPISVDRWHRDIHDFDARPYNGQVDLFVGGAPCQAFSMRGKRGGFEDTRGTLFREFARIVIECQPKVFIFENVKGMLNHDRGDTWKTIKQTFEEDCGYDVYYQVLNGKDYGVPQSRDRIYCIGFKKETDFLYPAPVPLTKSIFDYLDREVDKKYFLKEKGVRFITETINHQKSYTQINGAIQLCQKRNQQFNWHGDFVFHPLMRNDDSFRESDIPVFNVNDFEEQYYTKNTDERYAACCVCENKVVMRTVSSSEIDICRGCYRKLTPRECLRLMGFSDSFNIVVSDTETYKQAGNSIIVDVLIALLKQLDITKYGI